jgi:hypothetical protein
LTVIDEEVSLKWLIRSIARGFIDGVRRNKLAAVLAGVTLIVLISFAFDRQFDGLPRYQASILGQLTRLEATFHRSLRTAENASGEWRLYYFETAHSELQDILRAAKLARPGSYVARRKHREFIRYYELLDMEFHAIRTQIDLDANFDYLNEFTHRMEQLKPIRDAWVHWAVPKQTG